MKHGTPHNLIDLILHRAARQADDKAFYYLKDGLSEEVSISYGELLEKLSQIAGYCQAHQLEGERALLLYPPGLDYICGFLACICAKIIAVPVSSPLSLRAHAKLHAILKDAKAKVVFTTSEVMKDKRFQTFMTDAQGYYDFKIITTDNLFVGADKTIWKRPAVNEDTIAFLQYTSGSTSSPKGVMVSHGNLLQNSEYIHQKFDTRTDSFCVSWLPLYHDMGLIGTMLQPLYVGFPGLFMAPLHFIHKPWKWLKVIAAYKADLSGAPNFGYDYCTRKIKAGTYEDLDLSCWRVAFNGGEPLNYASMKGFSEKFSSIGFKWKTFAPCYGMAENTLLISGTSREEETGVVAVDLEHYKKGKIVLAKEKEVAQKILPSSGSPSDNTQVLIVDPQTNEICGAKEIGEIWVSGKSVTQGYWNNKTATKATYAKQIEGEERAYLKTGDLGFFYQGELFVTGRIKELLIIRGSNFYPQDIEKVVQDTDAALVSNAGAAFIVKKEEQQDLIMVQEVNRQVEEDHLPLLLRKIKANVFDHFGLKMKKVVFVRPFSVPKTSSGKIQRLKCRERFLSNQFDEILSKKLV